MHALVARETMMDTNEIVRELNALIQLDFDASRTYDQALKHVDERDVEVRASLESFRNDHLRHIVALRTVIEAHGGASIDPSWDLKGLLLEGMTKLRSVTGTLGALKAMRMNEKLTNRSYDRAAELELTLQAREVVLANLADERRHLAAIEAHIARLDREADELDDEADDADHPRVVPPPEDLHNGARI
jgi:rubrerythrin